MGKDPPEGQPHRFLIKVINFTQLSGSVFFLKTLIVVYLLIFFSCRRHYDLARTNYLEKGHVPQVLLKRLIIIFFSIPLILFFI
jgi:purine-cytosine permease-like protein